MWECDSMLGEKCSEQDLREMLEGMAKITSIVIVALGVKDWYPKWGGSLVGFRWVDQIWWLSYGPVAGGWEGPPFYSLGRPFYDFEDNEVKVPGMEKVSAELLESPSEWEKFEEAHPEAARHLSTVLRILAAATNRFEVPVVLMLGGIRKKTVLSYAALLPDDFRDEDVVRAIEAMVWVYDRLREAGFPLFE